MICEKCRSKNVNTQIISEDEPISCGGAIFYIILLFIPVLGWIALFSIITRKKSKTVTYAICQDCGNKIQVLSQKEISHKKLFKSICIILIILFIFFPFIYSAFAH